MMSILLIIFIPTILAAAPAPAAGGILTEIAALTAFRLALRDPLGALSNWDPSSTSAPCSWRGVLCSDGGGGGDSGRHVVELRLSRLRLSGRISDQISFLSHLRTLTLRSNSISGQIPPSLLSNLTNLSVFNLAENLLTGAVPAALPNTLRYLDLSSNALTGTIPTNLSAAAQLRFLNLSSNRLHGTIPGDFGRFQNLNYLSIDGNRLEGTLPSSLANVRSLVQISFEDNNLEGIVPTAIVELPNLQLLALSRNRFSGAVPASIFYNVSGPAPSLRVVQLGRNEFTELASPPVELISVSALKVFDLNQNKVSGPFPAWLSNVSSLEVLDVSDNGLYGELPSEIGRLTTLRELRLGWNLLTGAVPEEIGGCRALQVLDLEKNRFSGDIPYSLGGLSQLRELYIGDNLFSGPIPGDIGNLSRLVIFSAFNNNLSASFPLEIMRLDNLTLLDLSENEFTGAIPDNLGNLAALRILNLSKNSFSGSIPESVGGLVNLTLLDLSGQKNLSGNLPEEIFGLPSLREISLAENSFSGPIPEGFSSLWSLQYLNLSSNFFNGSIPSTYGYLQSLQVLSLSKNRISGGIPIELANCSNLTILELRSNQLSGFIPTDISRLSKLSHLDLGLNNLSGKIPSEIDNCSALVTLKLDSNHLSGNIPDSLSNLSKLEMLNLASNNLSGSIPTQLACVPGLLYFNVSDNNLSGEIPALLSSRFNDPAAFSGNSDLCGQPLHECHKKNKSYRILVISLVAAAALLLLLLCCCCFIFGLIRWRRNFLETQSGVKKRIPGRGSNSSTASGGENNGGSKLIMFGSRISYTDTIDATRQFDEENVLSRGRHGLLFKACYNDGTVLSILRLPSTSSDGAVVIEEGAFRKEAQSLGKVKHRNLTVLRGYYAGPPPDVRLLVYDYMPNGNLGTLLQEASHQDGQVLNWPMRHLIALGVARGLAFLHFSGVIHGDVKPQNILFDADFEPHLSDFGLEPMVVTAGAAEAAALAASTSVGSLGYVAPDAAAAGHATREGDAYSFGIVLLELLTGKRPGMFSGDEEDIVKWVKQQLQRGQVSELLEPGFLELDPESTEWEEFLLGIKVGLLCTAPDPLDRPSMADVVFMLEGCRVGPDIPSSADPTSLPSPA